MSARESQDETIQRLKDALRVVVTAMIDNGWHRGAASEDPVQQSKARHAYDTAAFALHDMTPSEDNQTRTEAVLKEVWRMIQPSQRCCSGRVVA